MTPSSLLLAWYAQHGRSLPWRNTRDPYHILVSEIMLQQTQVKRVLEYYPKWLAQFPDWASLANASNAEVIRAWSGLGYNRRALTLRDIAKQVVKKGVPSSREAWLELKGIGPYTSAALAVFSLHERHLPIDTNIRRVAARLLLGIPFPEASDDVRIMEKGDRLLPKRGRFFDVPQALFDVATDICKKKPECQRCPLQPLCPASKLFLSKDVEIPRRSIKKANESHHRDKPHPDRIYRGRLLRYVQNSPNGRALPDIGPQIDPHFDAFLDTDWLMAMIERMIRDGLVTKKRARLFISEG